MTSGGLAAVSASAFAALYSAFGKYDVVHIHAEGPAFFSWLPKMFGKRVVVTIHGVDWQREKWQSGFGSKFIRQGEKNAVKYADEIIVLSKGVQDYFKETYGRETHFIPNGVNRPQIRKANLITEKFGLKKDSYILFLGRLVPEKGIRYLVEAFKNVKTDKKLVIAGGSSDTDPFMEELKGLRLATLALLRSISIRMQRPQKRRICQLRKISGYFTVLIDQRSIQACWLEMKSRLMGRGLLFMHRSQRC